MADSTQRRSELYELVAQLRGFGMQGRLIARVLGVSSGYLAQIMADMGLDQRYRGASGDDAMARLPQDLQRRVAAFRTIPKQTWRNRPGAHRSTLQWFCATALGPTAGIRGR